MYNKENKEELSMSRTQRKYDHEYKVQAVKLAREIGGMILSILVDTFISKISLPMQPVPEIGSISVA